MNRSHVKLVARALITAAALLLCQRPAPAQDPPGSDCRDPVALGTGCYPYQGLFNPPRLGTSVNAHAIAQIRGGEAALLTLFNMDFEPGRASLNARGVERLTGMIGLLARCPDPLQIQPVAGEEALTWARLQFVAAVLDAGEGPVGGQRVRIATPPVGSLAGPDAVLIYRNLQLLTSGAGDIRTQIQAIETTTTTRGQSSRSSSSSSGGP